METRETITEQFCKLVRMRSAEHKRAFDCLHEIESISQQFSILRQELDSMVRSIFLLSIEDQNNRVALMENTIKCERWRQPNGHALITDRSMVELADKLHGWTQSVYSFGCSFIHLSNASSIQLDDRLSDFSHLTEKDRSAIIVHLRYYHGGPREDDPLMRDIVRLLPRVMDKISGNLECCLKDIERGESG